MSRQEELEAENWMRQFVADEPRLSMAVQDYEELGFEVHLEPFDPALCPDQECTTCFTENPEQYKIIFTRSKS